MTIATALQWIEVTQIKKIILCIDSCSALKPLKSFTSHSRQDIVNEIYEKFVSIQEYEHPDNIYVDTGSQGDKKS